MSLEALQPPGKPNDGVFSNLSAEPSVFIPPKDEPQAAPPAYTRRPIFGNARETVIAEADNPDVGDYWTFAIACLVCMTFNLLGLALAILIGDNNASYHGAVAGIGVYITINSATIGDAFRFSEAAWIRDLAEHLSFFLGMVGLVMFIGAIFSFRRIKRIT